MHSPLLRKAGFYVLIFNLMVATFPQHALAALIQTPDAIAAQKGPQTIERMNRLLAREDVRQQLVQMGIDPALAEDRVAALTEEEAAQLQQRLDSLPAGGDSVLAVIGIVFVVLLILELTGVINIFSKM
jgi:hypothetical protein